MVTKQFALELGQHGIRVNSVNPTIIATKKVKPFMDAKDVRALCIFERTPLKGYADVSDIVGPVLYLLSNLSAMVTGTLNPVDGGLCCNITTKNWVVPK